MDLSHLQLAERQRIRSRSRQAGSRCRATALVLGAALVLLSAPASGRTSDWGFDFPDFSGLRTAVIVAIALPTACVGVFGLVNINYAAQRDLSPVFGGLTIVSSVALGIGSAFAIDGDDGIKTAGVVGLATSVFAVSASFLQLLVGRRKNELQLGVTPGSSPDGTLYPSVAVFGRF